MEEFPSIAILKWGTGGSLGEGALPRPPADHGSFHPGRGDHMCSAVCVVGEGSRGQQRGQPSLLEVQMKKWHQTTRSMPGEDGQGAAVAASCQGGNCYPSQESKCEELKGPESELGMPAPGMGPVDKSPCPWWCCGPWGDSTTKWCANCMALNWVILPPEGISVTGCHNWEWNCSWHLAGRGQSGCLRILQGTGQLPHQYLVCKKPLVWNVNSTPKSWVLQLSSPELEYLNL